MVEAVARAANVRSQVNEKLVKALIALLAIRDEDLLDELCAVFAVAETDGGEVGRAPPEVWARVRKQMEVLQTLLDSTDEEEVEDVAGTIHH